MTNTNEQGTAPLVIRHEEELRIDTQTVEAGQVRIRKTVDTDHVEAPTDRPTESFNGIERIPPASDDSGEIETLPDGSISIPILEEHLVITKRLVVRERIIIRKTVITEQQTVTADRRRERVTIDGAVIEEDAPPADQEHVHLGTTTCSGPGAQGGF